jgi:hypothetical protein
MKRISPEEIARLCVKYLAWDEPVSQRDIDLAKPLFDTQLASCEKECKADQKEERQTLGKWIAQLNKEYEALSWDELSPQEFFDAMSKIQKRFAAGIEALKRGELPEGMVK